MYAFEYVTPASVDAAVAALRDNDEAKLLAGGMTLLPTMKLRLARPALIVDLNRLAALSGIREEAGAIVVGALTRHADVASSPLVRARLPVLATLAHGIGDAQVRNRGTVGGSLANNDPAADYPAAVLGLGASLITDRREIAGDESFSGMFETALAADEIVTAVRFPCVRRAGYAKFPNPASLYAVAGVLVADTSDGVRVAVTGAGPCVFRASAFEQALGAAFKPGSLDGLAIDSDGFNDDIHASAAYRAHLVAVMARRAVVAAAGC